jgi:transcriptional regulator with XRE-family HTH domain
MTGERPEPRQDRALLSRALKRLRTRSGRSKPEVAAAMNLSIRAYERFEAGDIRFNLDYVHRFARATDCDPNAILLAMAMGSPEFAVRSADNRFATILMIALRRFDETVGDGLSRMEVRTLVSAVTAMFDGLAARPSTPDPTRTWLEQGQAELEAKRPGPGR